MTQFGVFLLFDGSCRQAMEFYRACFGGDLTLTRVGESAAKNFMPAAMHERIVYAQLKGGRVQISASDWLMPNRQPTRGNTVCLYLSGGSKQELNGLFDNLSQGAEVTDPMRDEVHGLYGALNDKFGVRWMFQTNTKE